ncbi:TMV resistance protein N-like [Prosopis cineraria]|uniref:TMV resistance protein N-like n=1 Tax=Prosopis cineraria TaxID=364024 RepID=UPI002410111E|nr:TMV resistance protein N-like [Prosopis cineraria]
MTRLASWKYDVFINFRGEDTRYGFTGNLYHALMQKGIWAFMDDEELEQGDEIMPTLLQAIENSRMAIVVFSNTYASSTYCLNELVKIHQCVKGKDQLVLPIFYDVDPSEVRHQKENYGRALTMHKRNFRANERKIQAWKLALNEIANLSGFPHNPRKDYEHKLIERIVDEISKIINRVLYSLPKHHVGIVSRVQEINTLLQIGSNDMVNMVGICGIGGIGKTTIARAVCNSIAGNFDNVCFLPEIREDARKKGLEGIQEKMLSNIGVGVKIEDAEKGVEIIKLRVKQKKILLILDNVDKI